MEASGHRFVGVLTAVLVVMALPLNFAGKLQVLRTKFLPGALHAIEGSGISFSLLQQLGSAFVSAVWSEKMPLAHVGAILSLLDGPPGCDPGFYVLWCRFRLFRRYLAYRPLEAPRLLSLLGLVAGGCQGHDPIHLLMESANVYWFFLGSCKLWLESAWLTCHASFGWALSTSPCCHLGCLEVQGQL